MIHDTWYLILDTWYMIHDTWYMIHDTWYMIHDHTEYTVISAPPSRLHGGGGGVRCRSPMWAGLRVQNSWIWRVWGFTIGSNQSWVRTTVPQIFFHTYSRLPLYSCPTRALLETLYLQVCYMCLIYKCKIVFVACNEIAFCFIYIVGSLCTVAQGNDSVSTQVTLSLLHACIKYVFLQILDRI